MDDDFDSGLFNISISDSEGDDVDISHGFAQATKVDRKGQSEAQFQVVKRDYRPKVENGEVSSQTSHTDDSHVTRLTSFQVSKTVSLPLGQKVAKQEAQELLHAVEELYFFRKYDEAVTFLAKVFDGGEEGIDGDFQIVLKTYEKKCLEKLGRIPT